MMSAFFRRQQLNSVSPKNLKELIKDFIDRMEQELTAGSLQFQDVKCLC